MATRHRVANVVIAWLLIAATSGCSYFVPTQRALSEPEFVAGERPGCKARWDLMSAEVGAGVLFGLTALWLVAVPTQCDECSGFAIPPAALSAVFLSSATVGAPKASACEAEQQRYDTWWTSTAPQTQEQLIAQWRSECQAQVDQFLARREKPGFVDASEREAVPAKCQRFLPPPLPEPEPTW